MCSRDFRHRPTQNQTLWPRADDLLRAQQLQDQLLVNLLEVPKLDLARDGHHFDIKTVQWLVPQILAAIVPVPES
jgi:hypothetical protein